MNEGPGITERDGPPELTRIPKAVIKRLSLYSRELQNFEMQGVEKVSSQDLASALGFNSAQVRKDLAYFGTFGVPGLGYYVRDLRDEIKRILQTHREIRLGLVGAGNLGTALISYGGFARQNLRVSAVFDSDRRKIGSTRGGVRIHDIANLKEVIRKKKIDIIILAISAEGAQEVCNRAVEAGIRAILNFVPARLNAPPEVKIHYVDLSLEIESLSYYLR